MKEKEVVEENELDHATIPGSDTPLHLAPEEG